MAKVSTARQRALAEAQNWRCAYCSVVMEVEAIVRQLATPAVVDVVSGLPATAGADSISTMPGWNIAKPSRHRPVPPPGGKSLELSFAVTGYETKSRCGGDLPRCADDGRDQKSWGDLILMSRESLSALAAHYEGLADPDYRPGHVMLPRKRPDGVTEIGYASLSERSEAFLSEIVAAGWISPFDWVVWQTTPEGRQLLTDQSSIASATAEQLSRVLTTVVRQDRFAEGVLLEAFENGLMKAVAARAAVLLNEPL